jgi:hypothetical protein
MLGVNIHTVIKQASVTILYDAVRVRHKLSDGIQDLPCQQAGINSIDHYKIDVGVHTTAFVRHSFKYDGKHPYRLFVEETLIPRRI